MDNLELFEYMENHFPELEPMDFWRFMFPVSTFAKESQKNDKGYPLHGALLEKVDNPGGEPKPKTVPFWDELTELQRDVTRRDRDVHLYPVGFSGRSAKDKNASMFFGFVIDLDYLLPKYGISSLFSQIEKGVQPWPTLVSCSGGGLHLFYWLKEPLPCRPSIVAKLKVIRAELTVLLWNQYVTSGYKKPQIENVFQPMRAVGSRTKSGGTVRGFKTGDKVTLDYLLTFLPEAERRLSEMAKEEEKRRKSRVPLELAKEMYPDWYQERIVDGRPAAGFTLKNRGLYDYWLRTISGGGAVVGNRYFCLFCLAVFGIKSGVPKEEVEADAWGLYELFDGMSTDPKNHFRKQDVLDALKGYAIRYKKISKRFVEERTGLKFKEPRYQRRERRRSETPEERYERLALARETRDRKRQQMGLPAWNHHDSKESAVTAWREANPEGKPKECAEETGLSLSTVYRHWKAAKHHEEQRQKEEAAVLDSVIREMDGYMELQKQIEELDVLIQEQERQIEDAETVLQLHEGFLEYVKNHSDEIQNDSKLRKTIVSIYDKLQKLADRVKGGEANEA